MSTALDLMDVTDNSAIASDIFLSEDFVTVFMRGTDNHETKLRKVEQLARMPFTGLSWRTSGHASHDFLYMTSAVCRPGLTHLELCGQCIGASGVGLVASALATSGITHLDLVCTGAGDKGVLALVNVLPQALSLRTLFIGQNRVSCNAGQELARVLPRTRLTRLNVSYNPLGFRFVELLADALPRSVLCELNLGHCDVGDRGLCALASCLPHAPRLRDLKMNSNVFTASSIETLAQVLPRTGLTVLSLHNEHMYVPGRDTPLQNIARQTLLAELSTHDGAPFYGTPVREWNWTLERYPVWTENMHAARPRAMRAIIATLLVIANSDSPRTRAMSCGLNGGNVVAIRALFRWIARLKFFEC